MRIFLSYASEDKAVAETIAFSLRARKHTVFLDRDDLPAGGEYDRRIEQAVSQAGLLVFLISPESVARGRFTLTELEFARRKWRKADGHVLPVMIEPTAMTEVPGFLKSVTILEPKGNAAAEVASAVDAMASSTVRRGTLLFAGFGLASGLLTEPLMKMMSPFAEIYFGPVPLGLVLSGFAFAATMTLALGWHYGFRQRHVLLGIAVMIGWYLALLVFYFPREAGPGHYIYDPQPELELRCEQASAGQLTADAELEKSCLELNLRKTREELSSTTIYWNTVSFFSLSGAIGAIVTALGVPFASGRSHPISGIFATAFIGMAIGLLYSQLKDWAGLYILFISWQTAVAATIGRFLR